HLAWLGVDAVWLSPIFRSPMKDFGYDVADYCDVDPLFGTLADFDRLLAEAHARGIRVLLDWVPNHTSDLHPWFRESRASRASPKRARYVWRDPAPGGGPPNNWLASFPRGSRARTPGTTATMTSCTSSSGCPRRSSLPGTPPRGASASRTSPRGSIRSARGRRGSSPTTTCRDTGRASGRRPRRVRPRSSC